MSDLLFIKMLKWYFLYRKSDLRLDQYLDKEYYTWYKQYRPALEKFKDCHAGEDCFIIGNGPSLNRTDLSRLDGHYVFGLNKIHLIFDKYPLKLSYHVAVNPLVIAQMQDELTQDIFGCPSFLSFQSSKDITSAYNNIYKLHTGGRWSFNRSILEPINEGYTVTYVALQIAYYMGFKNVFLVGMDHHFEQKGAANETQVLQGEDVNHFHPDYFKGNVWQLADLEGSEGSYALARHRFHIVGRNIYNATVGGKLEIFERMPFEQAVATARKRK